MTAAAGARVGPYEIVALLGAGGMGEVWRARDTRLGRDVAIKVLPATFADDPDRLRRFEQEARATAALNHPNILAIHDIGSHEGQPYLVEELLEGESLRARVRGGALPVARVVELAVQVAQGLAAAHEKGIVHRDLKPENLFLTRSGHLKILDFGLAKLARPDGQGGRVSEVATHPADTGEGHVLGTVGYMAPEQVRGLPCDHRVDVFAFGCVLYELLSGQRPFSGATAADTMSAILSRDPPPLAAPDREIPPVLQGIVTRCLEKAPEDRFQSTRDLAFNLGMLSRLSGLASGPTTPLPGTAKPPKRRWVTMAGAVAAVAALVGGSLWLGHRWSEPPVVRCTRLTFRRGWVSGARFALDGKTVVYSASWNGAPSELFSIRLGTPESTPLGYTKADLLAVSSKGELALQRIPGSPMSWSTARNAGQTVTLATAPLSGGTPKDLADSVSAADFTPDGAELAAGRWGSDTTVEFPLGSTPRKTPWVMHLRVSPDRRSVAILGGGGVMGDRIHVLDSSGNLRAVAQEFQSGGGLAWSPRGDEIWYTDRNELCATTLDGRRRVLYGHTGQLFVQDVATDLRVLVTTVQRVVGVFFRGPNVGSDRELSWLDRTIVHDLSADGRYIAFFESEQGVGYKSVSYLRETSGAPPMRLGEGMWPRISADGRFVVVVGEEGTILVHPVGAGTTRKVPLTGFRAEGAGLLHDGTTLWFVGERPPQAPGEASSPPERRLWLTDLEGSKPRPVTPWSGGVGARFTPDGRHVLAKLGDTWQLVPLAGGPPVPLPGVQPGEAVAGFAADGTTAYVYDRQELPARVFRLDLGTGNRELLHEIMPPDRSGLGILGFGGAYLLVRASADGRSVVYGYDQTLSELYLIEGLR